MAEALGVSAEEAAELICLGAVYVGSSSTTSAPTKPGVNPAEPHEGEAAQKLVRAARLKEQAPQLLVQQASTMGHGGTHPRVCTVPAIVAPSLRHPPCQTQVLLIDHTEYTAEHGSPFEGIGRVCVYRGTS